MLGQRVADAARRERARGAGYGERSEQARDDGRGDQPAAGAGTATGGAMGVAGMDHTPGRSGTSRFTMPVREIVRQSPERTSAK